MSITKRISKSFKLAPIVIALMAAPAFAFDDGDQAKIEQIVRDYLLENPEIMFEMQQAYEAKQKAQQVALQAKTLRDRKAEIYNSEHHIEIGNKDAKIEIVEFFDYNCPFCQRAMNDMEAILAKNNDVKFIIKEWPVLGQNSADAHNVSLALHKLHPEKYEEFHRRLLAMKGSKGESEAVELAVSMGANKEALLETVKDPSVIAAFTQANSLATDLGITGTPSYVIGDEVVFGAVGVAELTRKIEAMRK